jgi:hypothetical protein
MCYKVGRLTKPATSKAPSTPPPSHSSPRFRTKPWSPNLSSDNPTRGTWHLAPGTRHQSAGLRTKPDDVARPSDNTAAFKTSPIRFTFYPSHPATIVSEAVTPYPVERKLYLAPGTRNPAPSPQHSEQRRSSGASRLTTPNTFWVTLLY